MVDTPRTQGFLLGSEFQDGQAVGSITPQRMRDFIVSGPQWDAVSGTATPYLLRGTLDAAAYFVANGGVVGAGQTTLQRQTNATVLQNAINYCCTNGKFFELSPGVYEINSSTGLLIPPQGAFGNFNFIARGAQNGTVISQFYATASGAPILTIGDVTNVTEMSGANISGFTLQYGVSVTGLTSAIGLRLGWMVDSEVNDIIMNGFTFPPFDSVHMDGLAFSNNYRNWLIWGFQRHGYYVNGSTTTGCSHDNWYMTAGGNPTFPAVSGNFIFFNVVASDMWFSRLNCEWTQCNAVIRAGDNAACFGLKIDALHLEGIQLQGVNPAIFHLASTTLQVSSMDLQSCSVLSGNLTSGNYALVFDWQGGNSTILIENYNYVQNAGAGFQTSNFYLLAPYALDDNSTVMTVAGGLVSDPSNQAVGALLFDQHLAPTANVLINKWNRYEFGLAGSLIRRAVLVVNGTYTHYGQHEDATIDVPVSITAFTITLATTMGATGTQKPRTGSTTHVRRRSGTVSGTLTIAYGGTSTPTVNTTSATDYWYIFDGSLWQTFTPVT